MKYVRKVKGGWLFDPPQAAIDAGVVKRKFYKDGRGFRYEVPRFINSVEQWRKGKLAPEVLNNNSTLLQAIAFYKDSVQFKSLSKSSHKAYNSAFNKIEATANLKYGRVKLKDLNVYRCREAYESWVEDYSVPMANYTKSVFSVVINFVCALDILPANPMSRVSPLPHEPERVLHTKEDVDRFLRTAFTDYKWRNVGMIVYLCYEWGQRPVDIRNLKWDALDFEKKVCTIKQSKRGATVYLPIWEDLEPLLLEQRDLYDFQGYVFPNLNTTDKVPKRYESVPFTNTVREIREAAGLPDTFIAGGLRTTAIVEARDAGGDAVSIQQFTGHKRLDSLSPYMKFTPEGARNALRRRR